MAARLFGGRSLAVADSRACVLALALLSFPAPSFAQSGPPVAAYGFDEGTGTTLTDASGNGFHCTLTNGPSWTTGQHGSALQFNASDDSNDDNDPRVVLGRSFIIPDLPLTISAWVHPTDYADYRAIISQRDSADASDTRLDLTLMQGTGQVYLWNGDFNAFHYAPPVNVWTHLAVVADSYSTRLYVNGVLVETIGPVTLGPARSANAVIGGTGEGNGGDNDPFKGKIDDLRVYNRALTQAEIQADMNAPVAPLAPETIPPSAPSGLTATAVNGVQIDLAWTASTDNVLVAGYRVERCQGEGCANFVQVGAPTSNSFGNAGLTPLTSYSYRVRAIDPAGNLSAYSNVASATTSSTVPPDPVAAYGFDDGAGTTLTDSSSNGFHGTLTNGPTWTTGQHGSALQFDASDDGNDNNDPRVVLGRTINIPDLPLTISAWVHPTDYTDWRAIISKRDSPMAWDMRLDVGLSVDSGRVYVYTGSPYTFHYAPPVNAWTHLAVVADSYSTRLYVNGELLQTIGAITLGTNTSANTVIGGTGEGNGGDNDPFKGKIDDLRMYNRALNAAEIQADMNASASGPQPDVSPPTAPSGLTATAVNTSKINLSWTGSTDNVGVTGYKVERCQGVGCVNFVEIAAPTATSFNDPSPAARTTYSYRVRAADAAGNLSGYCNVASAAASVISLTVASPAPGAIIASDSVTVSGTYIGPNNTGITVNGIVAAIVGSTFVAANVPLQPGANTLTATLTTPDNQTATETLSVTSTGPASIEVFASPTQGVAPLGVTFTINNRTGNAIQSVQADYLGTGSFVNVNPNVLSSTYTASGLYQAAFVIIDSTGASYQRTVPVTVQDTAQIDQVLRTTWSEFSTSLAARDTVQALRHFNAQAQQKFQSVFQTLAADLPQILSSFSPPQLVSVTNEIGEYAINRTIGGVDRIFFIYFMRDVDGVWRIDDM